MILSSVIGRGGGTVNLDIPANQLGRRIKQPTVSKQKKITGEEPVIVAEWNIKKFVWFSEFLNELPEVYELLLKRLNVDPDDYSSEIEGFYCYYHNFDWNKGKQRFDIEFEGKMGNRKCDVECIYIPAVRAGKYHPYTSVKHRRRASSRTLDRLEFLEEECRKRRVKFDYVITIDLTLPKQVSHRWNDSDVQCRIREAVKDFLLELHNELFPGHKSKFGVIANHHFWASRSPLSTHRHVHLTLPNVTFNPKTGMFHRFQPYIDANLIRRVWKSALKKNGLWNNVPDDVKPDVYTQYIKFEERNRIIHRLSYCSRKPIEDLVRTSKSDNDFAGVVENNDFDRDFVLFLLNYTPRVVNLGFLTNLKRFGYSRKSTCLKCPVCGGDMHPVIDEYGHSLLYDRPPPDIPGLFRARNGEWRRLLSPSDFVGGE